MKAIIVARVSTEEQKDAGNSLPAQTQRLKNYCERKGLTIIAPYSFDESAYKENRTEFDKILAEVQESKEKIAVCFDKVDRFSRNVFDKRVAALYDLAIQDKIELHFASDNLVINSSISAQEKFQFGISLGLAKYYSDAISDNTKRAFEQKRRNGDWNGKPCIGYVNTQNSDGKKDIVPDPQRAHLIQKLFQLYATGTHSITSLWIEMSKLGLRSLEGRKLSRSNIELILKDAFYYGLAHSKKYGTYPHRYQTLISRELFEKCQEIRKGRNRMPSKILSKPYILKGVLSCKNCGCLMTPEIKKGKFIYYSCTNAKGICKRTYVPEGVLLQPILAVLDRFERIPKKVQERLVAELRTLNEGEAEFHSREIARVRSEYDRTQKRIQTLLDMRLDESISKEDYDSKLEELKTRQYRLNIELEEHTKADHQFHIHVETVLNLCRRMRQIFEGSEPEEKRAFLGFLLQNPTVDGKKLEFTMRKPFDTVLEVALNPTGLRR